MKKIVFAMLLMTGITVVAQRDDIRGRENHMKDLSTEQMATLQTKKMTLALDLNEEQQRKMKSLLATHIAARKAKMEAHKAKKENGEKLRADEKYTLQVARLDAQIAHKQGLKTLLTEAQYNKWEKMQHKSQKHRKGRTKEGRKRKK
jgi:hypothetical protein